MQEDHFQKFSKYFQEKLESGELLTNILQSNRENNLEVVKTLVGYGTTIKAEHYKLAANSKNLKTCIYLEQKAKADAINQEDIKAAEQNYISFIAPQFQDCKNIKTAGDLFNFIIIQAQYFDPNTIDIPHTLKLQAQYEEKALSGLVGDSLDII